MYEALIEAFDTAGRDPEVGALLVSGNGGLFTAGNDIGFSRCLVARDGRISSVAVCEQSRRVRKAVDRGD
jgi:enoyl-CoA hydratase/carnithine racemase